MNSSSLLSSPASLPCIVTRKYFPICCGVLSFYPLSFYWTFFFNDYTRFFLCPFFPSCCFFLHSVVFCLFLSSIFELFFFRSLNLSVTPCVFCEFFSLLLWHLSFDTIVFPSVIINCDVFLPFFSTHFSFLIIQLFI